MCAADVAFCGLDGDVTKRELNLFQLAASGPAQAGATSAEIVRRELHATEKAATGNSSDLHPVVQETLHPIRDGDGSNVTSLPAQIHDCPMPFALLEMANSQRGEFVATEPASKKYGKQSPISFAFDPLAVWRLPERLTLVGA